VSERRTPWLGGWPVFWREIVYVLVATAVGNVVLAGGACAALYVFMHGIRPGGSPSVLVLLLVIVPYCVHVTAVLTSLVPGLLSGAENCIRRDMGGAFSLGALGFDAGVFAAGGVVWLCRAPFWVTAQIATAVMLPGAFFGFSVAVHSFAKRIPEADVDGLRKAFWAGVATSVLGLVWACATAIAMLHRIPADGGPAELFGIAATALALLPLSGAVTAVLLLRAVEGKDRGESN